MVRSLAPLAGRGWGEGLSPQTRCELSGEQRVGWAKPPGRANARPMTGSACRPFRARIELVGTARCAFAHPTLSARECDAHAGRGEGGAPLLPRNFVVDAFHVEIHAEDLAVVEMVAALAFHLLAVLADDRAFERMQLACGDGGLRFLGHLLHVVGHVGIGRHLEHFAVEYATNFVLFPDAVVLGLVAGNVYGRPG